MATKSKKAKKVAEAVVKTYGERENLYLPPSEYGRVNSRDKSADPKYADKVADLAVNIAIDGQLEPAVAFRDADGKPVLFAGNTRADAVQLIREGFEADDPRTGDRTRFHNPDLVLHAVVLPGVTTKEEAYILSVTENFKRNNLNPVQEAIVHETLRAEPYNWSDTRIANQFGFNNTNRVAKLKAIRENLTDKYQDYIAAERLAVYPAFDLIQVPAEERDALLAKAAIDPTDPESKFDGSVIRTYLQAKQAAVSEETGTGDEGASESGGEEGGEGESGGSTRSKAAPKKNAKDLEKLAEAYKNEEGADDRVTALLGTMVKWFQCKCGDKAFFNALDRFKNS